MTKITYVIIALIAALAAIMLYVTAKRNTLNTSSQTSNPTNSETTLNTNKTEAALYPMSIKALRQRQYPGGDFVIEQTLTNGMNYKRYVVSYLSDGLKIYGLLTVPLAPKPANGYPAIIFVHGHIPPAQYSTINSYPTYQATLAKAGFITFKPDLRGNGKSEGEAASAHYSADYVIDTMNAISYLKMYPEVDPNRLGYWGHSNGGEIGLRVLVISKDIKAASLWAGVVGSYQDMYETYVDKIRFLSQDNPLTQQYGLPSQNPDVWNQLDPYAYLNDINIPIQLQHATGDTSVPIELSRSLKSALEKAGKKVEYIEYQDDDHNISKNSSLAWQKTIDFFNRYLSEPIN